ncbi:substrate-binding domain-containing protein [Vibrio lentus]|nr:substrate-binding domain-containing protein [Vibrio lentus]
MQGYLAALSDYKIELSDSYGQTIQRPPVMVVNAGERTCNQVCRSPNLVAYNDYMAAGALSVLDENGIQAPDKVSIVGFDDGNCSLHSPLS